MEVSFMLNQVTNSYLSNFEISRCLTRDIFARDHVLVGILTMFVHINVGGTIFNTKLTTLKKYPKTRLGLLTYNSEEYVSGKDFFFFDRNPELFNIILDYYRNDCVHIPSGICSTLVEHELEYWTIPLCDIAPCCRSNFLNAQNETETSEKIKQSLKCFQENPLQPFVKINGSWLQKTWLFMEEPLSSRSARVYNAFYTLIVLLSDILLFLIAYPDIRVQTFNNVDSFINKTGVDKYNPKEVMFATTELPEWWVLMDIILTTFFTIEFTVRFIVCPRKRSFFKNPLNVLDCILNISMWLRFGLEQDILQIAKSPVSLWTLIVIYAIGPLRLLRVFRISKQYRELRIILISINESLKELALLFFSLLILSALFANVVYCAEIGEPTTFPNAFSGIWWAVVTMTTVGYGDVFPKSVPGKVVGGICAICGVFALAMPMAIIASKFHTYYKKMKDMTDFKNKMFMKHG